MSRFDDGMSRFAGTGDGTKAGGHGGTPLQGVPLSDVPNVPPNCPDELSRSWAEVLVDGEWRRLDAALSLAPARAFAR